MGFVITIDIPEEGQKLAVYPLTPAFEENTNFSCQGYYINATGDHQYREGSCSFVRMADAEIFKCFMEGVINQSPRYAGMKIEILETAPYILPPLYDPMLREIKMPNWRHLRHEQIRS